MCNIIHSNRYERPGNCYTGAIGPGITNHRQDADDKKFMAAIAQLPKDIFEMTHVQTSPAHEPHGVGHQELPAVVAPEEFMDRYVHNLAFKAIMMFETELLKTAPIPSAQGSVVSATIKQVFNGRVEAMVKQAYLDVGWKTVEFVKAGDNTTIKLLFP